MLYFSLFNCLSFPLLFLPVFSPTIMSRSDNEYDYESLGSFDLDYKPIPESSRLLLLCWKDFRILEIRKSSWFTLCRQTNLLWFSWFWSECLVAYCAVHFGDPTKVDKAGFTREDLREEIAAATLTNLSAIEGIDVRILLLLLLLSC